MQLALASEENFDPISPLEEMGAYEALWDEHNASFKSIAEKFLQVPGLMPSNLVEAKKIEEYKNRALEIISKSGLTEFGIRVRGAAEYPYKLQDAKWPVELLYYRGWWELIESPSIAVVGTRNPSLEGIARTKKLTKLLVQDGYTIVSGLAKGVDRVAHLTALKEGGKTIGVIGTPLTEYYPKENKSLQDLIAEHFLIVSPIPFVRYSNQNPRTNRFFFPERNKVMSALTLATVIIEAGETSGTLVQARAALEQGRKLFVLDSCFQNKDITWPARLEKQGAIRVADYKDIREHLIP